MAELGERQRWLQRERERQWSPGWQGEFFSAAMAAREAEHQGLEAVGLRVETGKPPSDLLLGLEGALDTCSDQPVDEAQPCSDEQFHPGLNFAAAKQFRRKVEVENPWNNQIQAPTAVQTARSLENRCRLAWQLRNTPHRTSATTTQNLHLGLQALVVHTFQISH